MVNTPRKGNTTVIAVIVVALVAFAGFMFYKNSMMKPAETAIPAEEVMQPSPSGEAMMTEGTTYELSEQNASGVYGTANLKEVDGKVVVTLSMTGGEAGVAEPAHIHVGACPTPGAVSYPLTSVTDGTSETTLDVDLATLMTELPLAINVHKSADEASVYIACGDITAQDAMMKKDEGVMMEK